MIKVMPVHSLIKNLLLLSAWSCLVNFAYTLYTPTTFVDEPEVPLAFEALLPSTLRPQEYSHAIPGKKWLLNLATDPLGPSETLDSEASGISGAEDACSATNSYDYSTLLHVGFIFVIFLISLCGAVTPMIAKKMNWCQVGGLPFQLLKLFGAGVIFSTGFVHMFVPATQNLTDPCLRDTIFGVYTGFSGVFALVGALSIQAIQLIANRIIAKNILKANSTHTRTSSSAAMSTLDESGKPILNEPHDDHDQHHHDHVHSLIHVAEKRVSVYLLELGIASHSILIGLTLGLCPDEAFAPLCVALCFHQFFEGLALSSTLMEVDFKTQWAAICMVLVYSCGTSIGIAIGVIIHTLNATHATNLLIASGILDAISAGILIFDVLVNIVQPHLASKRFKTSSGVIQLAQVGALWLGACVMSIIGIWS